MSRTPRNFLGNYAAMQDYYAAQAVSASLDVKLAWARMAMVSQAMTAAAAMYAERSYEEWQYEQKMQQQIFATLTTQMMTSPPNGLGPEEQEKWWAEIRQAPKNAQRVLAWTKAQMNKIGPAGGGASNN